MDLIIYQMMELQVVHVSDGYRAVKIFSGTAVAQADFTVASKRYAFPERSVLQMASQIFHQLRICFISIFFFKFFPGGVDIIVCQFQGILNINLVCSVENRCGNIESKRSCSKA